jgi:hypothetical protein
LTGGVRQGNETSVVGATLKNMPHAAALDVQHVARLRY